MKNKYASLGLLLILFCGSPTVLSCEDSYDLIRNHYNSQLLIETEIKRLSADYTKDFEDTIVALDLSQESSIRSIYENIEKTTKAYFETGTEYMNIVVEEYEDNLYENIERQYEVHPNIENYKETLKKYEEVNLETMKLLYEMDVIGEKMIIEFAEAIGLQTMDQETYIRNYIDDFSKYNELNEEYAKKYEEYLVVENTFYQMNLEISCSED